MKSIICTTSTTMSVMYQPLQVLNTGGFSFASIMVELVVVELVKWLNK